MTYTDPLFTYLTILSIIQPARIQDIENYAPSIIPSEIYDTMIFANSFREVHAFARDNNYILSVRKGTYFLTAKGRAVVRRKNFYRELDNSRIFLMKDQRKYYK